MAPSVQLPSSEFSTSKLYLRPLTSFDRVPRLVVRPEMHEQQVRLVVEHMTMQRR